MDKNFNKIINKSGTNKDDLNKLLAHMGIRAGIDWGYNFNKRIPMMILNLGKFQGTHWVAVDNKHKRYFDSFGLPPPEYIPKDYEYTTLQIQDINTGRCGQYVSLWLYYSSINEIDKFYNMFTIE